MAGRTLTANQINFLDLLIDNLTAAGVVDPSRQYEAPYTRFSAQAVEGVFKDAEVTLLVQVLEEVKLATRVVALKTRVLLHLPSVCPDKAILHLALERLLRLAC